MREEMRPFRNLVELGIKNGWINPPDDHVIGQKRIEIQRMLNEGKMSHREISERSGATMRYVQQLDSE